MNISALLIATVVSIASVDGYVQTPIGGRPGSSSLLRPRLGELGIQHVSIVDNLFTLGKWYTGSQQIRAEGNTLLKNTLKTYGRSIIAGTELKSGIKFDWYRAGIAYPIRILSQWSVVPAIELIIFDFGYRFKTPMIFSGRTYRQMGMRVGLTVKSGVMIHSYFVSIPGLGRVLISTDSVGTNTEGRQSIQIFFKDSQPLPNQLFLKAAGEFRRHMSQVPHSPISPLYRLFIYKKSLGW